MSRSSSSMASMSTSASERQPRCEMKFMRMQNTSSLSVEPTGSKSAGPTMAGTVSKDPACANIPSRPPQVRTQGWRGFAWYVWIICMLADDHNFYWHHRLSHSIRVLWAAHLPHHSAKTFNLTVSIRNGWFITLYKPIFWMWLPLVGFEPIMIATCLIMNSFYQFFLHSQLVPSLPLYEKLFNTPYIHTVHHSSNTEYLDFNHGGILTIWDRLYGTWQPPIKGVAPKYGINHNPGTDNPITHNLFEFQEIWKDVKKAPGLKNKFMYIFGPPGWSHDGSSMTSRQLQRELKQARAEGREVPEHIFIRSN